MPSCKITGQCITLLAFMDAHICDCLSAGNVITVDGQTLSIPAVVAAARYPWPLSKTDGKEQITLSTNPDVRREVQKSRDVIDAKVKAGKSIYGVTTGVGGSGEIDFQSCTLRSSSYDETSSRYTLRRFSLVVSCFR